MGMTAAGKELYDYANPPSGETQPADFTGITYNPDVLASISFAQNTQAESVQEGDYFYLELFTFSEMQAASASFNFSSEEIPLNSMKDNTQFATAKLETLVSDDGDTCTVRWCVTFTHEIVN